MTLYSVAPQYRDLGNGHYMVGTCQVDSVSRVAKLHVDETCTNKLFGFTGGAKMIYFDPHGTKLGESPTGAWGINQAPIIGANHRPCDLVDTAPEGVGLVILSQFWAPKVRFNEILTGVEQAVKDITTAIVYIEQFCQNNPTLCSWVTNAASGPVPGDAGGGDGTATAVSEKESSTVN